MIHIISLGAGVQSSTMALMAAAGEITPMPDCAIFADTGAESRNTYKFLDWIETQLPFPVHRVMEADGLLENIRASVSGGSRVAQPPLFAGASGQLRRACTSEFKIKPIDRKVREILGLAKGQRGPKEVSVVMWQGISTDEVQRARHGVDGWRMFRYPLIEKRMDRKDCMQWMWDNKHPLPMKSACTFCPYHSDEMWRDMKLHDRSSWEQAVEVDHLIRRGVRGTTEELFLHRSLKPLDEVDFRNAVDMGQIDAFAEECEGMCGI